MRLDQYGAGPRTFLGLHGWAGNRRTFRRLLAYLPADATFYTGDLPGYGDAPRTSRIDLDAVMSDVLDAMRQVSDPNLTLVGHCGGAWLALEALRLSTGLARGAVLIEPFGYAPLYFRIFTWGDFGRYAYLTTFANPLGRIVTNGALARKRTGAANLTSAFRAVDHETALDYIRLYCAMRPAERFPGLADPVDVVYGERTFAAVRRSIPIWRSTLPNVRCTELQGAGHEPIREATEQLAAVVFGAASDAASAPSREAPC